VAHRLIQMLQDGTDSRVWEFLRGNAGTAKTTMVVTFCAIVRTLYPKRKLVYVSAQHAQCNDLIESLELAGLSAADTNVVRYGHNSKARHHRRHIERAFQTWLSLPSLTDPDWLRDKALITGGERAVEKAALAYYHRHCINIAVVTAQGLAGQRGFLQLLEPDILCADEASQLHAFVLYNLDLPAFATIRNALVVGGQSRPTHIPQPDVLADQQQLGPFGFMRRSVASYDYLSLLERASDHNGSHVMPLTRNYRTTPAYVESPKLQARPTRPPSADFVGQKVFYDGGDMDSIFVHRADRDPRTSHFARPDVPGFVVLDVPARDLAECTDDEVYINVPHIGLVQRIEKLLDRFHPNADKPVHGLVAFAYRAQYLALALLLRV
jgi:hypothetical protein